MDGMKLQMDGMKLQIDDFRFQIANADSGRASG